MSYENLTPAEFKTAKPQFTAVPDETVQAYIDMGALFVDESWPESTFKQAWIAITCHLMTLDGLGTDVVSQAFVSGLAIFQTIKSGEVTLTKYQSFAESGGSYTDWLTSSPCGKFYMVLLRAVKRGPRVIMGANVGCVSPYAKDVPLAWPEYFFGWR